MCGQLHRPHVSFLFPLIESSALKKWQIDEDGKSPILNARVNVDWLIGSHWTQGSLLISSQLNNGMLYDVFTQKASMDWHAASTCHVVVSLPSTLG